MHTVESFATLKCHCVLKSTVRNSFLSHINNSYLLNNVLLHLTSSSVLFSIFFNSKAIFQILFYIAPFIY